MLNTDHKPLSCFKIKDNLEKVSLYMAVIPHVVYNNYIYSQVCTRETLRGSQEMLKLSFQPFLMELNVYPALIKPHERGYWAHQVLSLDKNPLQKKKVVASSAGWMKDSVRPENKLA